MAGQFAPLRMAGQSKFYMVAKLRILYTCTRMRFLILFLTLSMLSATTAIAHMAQRKVSYELDGVKFKSVITWDSHKRSDLPGILMVPNWMGPTKDSLKKAQEIAGQDYIVMMVDMYGVDVRPKDSSEASAAAGAVRADREQMRKRALKALEEFLSARRIPLDKEKMAAIGFCFGGGTVLEMSRAGADVDAVVSFHGDLMSPTLESDAANTKAKVLVLHGADDPYVPQEHVETFTSVMEATEVDWELIQYEGTVHSFTDPKANAKGAAEYNPESAKRAFEAMEKLFGEIW